MTRQQCFDCNLSYADESTHRLVHQAVVTAAGEASREATAPRDRLSWMRGRDADGSTQRERDFIAFTMFMSCLLVVLLTLVTLSLIP